MFRERLVNRFFRSDSRYPSFLFKPYSLGKTGKFHGGDYYLLLEDHPIGHAGAAFETEDIEYPFSGLVPAGTVVIDTIEIDERYQGKGYGSTLLNHIIEDARKYEMKRVWAIHVMSDAEGWWRKEGFRYSKRGRIWVREL